MVMEMPHIGTLRFKYAVKLIALYRVGNTLVQGNGRVTLTGEI